MLGASLETKHARTAPPCVDAAKFRLKLLEDVAKPAVSVNVLRRVLFRLKELSSLNADV